MSGPPRTRGEIDAELWLSRLESDGQAINQRQLTDEQLDRLARITAGLVAMAARLARRATYGRRIGE